jgi:tetratricopeptide (TPR) repeat protein
MENGAMVRVLLALFASLVCCLPLADACLWDRDTLQMERQRFPDALELITGRFPRHSKPFYDWRIRNAKRRLAAGESDASIYDDLAVAYEKTGRSELAIETALKTDELFPGRYETYANLATFYIHSRQFEQGLAWIDRALAINPDAHFGREEYQKLLVQYVLENREGETLELPIDSSEQRSAGPLYRGFAGFVLKCKGLNPGDSPESADPAERELDKALKGVLGMMRFGNFDSPVLLEALGDLLISGRQERDARRLASRAWLAAASVAPLPESRRKYRTLAESALKTHLNGNAQSLQLSAVEADFRREVADARKWYSLVEIDERTWIRKGLDPEAEFNRKYYNEPVLKTED